jgi:NADPH-dependent curcumin reductase CurA
VPDGSVIVKNVYISIDATMRVWISGVESYLPPVKPQDVMRAFCVGQVIYSKSKKFNIGDMVIGLIGWQKYAIMK